MQLSTFWTCYTYVFGIIIIYASCGNTWSAAYISNDSELRREIFKGLDSDSDVLKKMGSAEMQREIERRVLPLADKVKMSTDIEYPNLDMDREDLKMLIDDVLKEVYRGTHSKRDNH